jgi:hypothetical protein
MINEYFNGYQSNNNSNNIILTGSGAILYYLIISEMFDLIEPIEELEFIVTCDSDTSFNCKIMSPFIGDFKKMHEHELKYQDLWGDIVIRKFKLTQSNDYIFYSRINNIKIIKLNQLENNNLVTKISEKLNKFNILESDKVSLYKIVYDNKPSNKIKFDIEIISKPKIEIEFGKPIE